MLFFLSLGICLILGIGIYVVVEDVVSTVAGPSTILSILLASVNGFITGNYNSSRGEMQTQETRAESLICIMSTYWK